MNTPSAKMLVLVGKQFACVKIVGRANFSSSIDFKTLVEELKQRKISYFVLDLSECALMDSTFLGVLAGMGLKLGNQSPSGEKAIELLNPNARITELLENLGVLHLFKLTLGPVQLPEATEAHPVNPLSPSKEDLTRAALEAHQTLMDINPANVVKFKDLAQFLAEDLKKLKGGDVAP